MKIKATGCDSGGGAGKIVWLKINK